MIHVWTDGCSKGNPGPGGASVVIVLPDGAVGQIGRPLGPTTNNRAELLAVRVALEALAAHRQESMTMHTDSQNVIGWLTGAFRVNANVDLVREIQDCLWACASVSFAKVRGHSGDANNEAADRLAQRAAAGVTVQEWGSASRRFSVCAQLAQALEALGRKRLLPTRYARKRERIERCARDDLRHWSYETELGCLVPKVRWPELREKLISYQAQYEQLVEAITSATAYTVICDELRTIYTQAARQVWKIRQGLSARAAPPYADSEVAPETEEEFVTSFVARILQTIPAPAALRARFSFTWTVRYLELPSRIAEDLRQAELTRL